MAKKKEVKPVQLQSAHLSDVATFQGTSVGILAEVFRRNVNPINPFSGRESALHVTITNQGEIEIENAIVEAKCSENLQLVDSGALFGSGRRHVRLPLLKPKKSIKYKLALRPSQSLTSGTVTFELRSADWKSADQLHTVTLGVSRQD
jgi:hypothetical protein